MKQTHVIFYLCLLLSFRAYPQSFSNETILSNSILRNQWAGKHVAFLGDSITDKQRVGTAKVYWEYLKDLLHIHPHVYGRNGHTWKEILSQAERLDADRIDSLSAIIIFAGTNDFNANIPLGKLYTESLTKVNHNGKMVDRNMREIVMDEQYFYGRINKAVEFLKTKFPKQQIILLTPLHRGYASFGEANVQPDERYANAHGNYISDFVKAIQAVAFHWSIPVIDLFGESGLYPSLESYNTFFANKERDLLHPNALGHDRIALHIAYKLLSFPAF